MSLSVGGRRPLPDSMRDSFAALKPTRARRLVLGQPGVLAEARQLHADQHLQQGRSRLGPFQIGFQTGDTMRRGGHPDSQQTGTRAVYTIASQRAAA
ncbi:hypothetical protein SHIRM173S_08796 [Streptomyces hirsutus]